MLSRNLFKWPEKYEEKKNQTIEMPTVHKKIHTAIKYANCGVV